MTQPQNRPRVEIVAAKKAPTVEQQIQGPVPKAPSKPIEREHLMLLAGGAVLAAALVGAAALVSAIRSPAPALPELAAATADTEAALAQLVADGLPAQGVTVRDWAAIDGDGVYANGVPITATGTPTPIGLAPGTLTLNAFAGSAGCITLEVTAPGRPPYQLCLAPNTPTPAIPVR